MGAFCVAHSSGKRNCNRRSGMDEAALDEETLRGVRAEHHSVDAPQVLLTADDTSVDLR